MPPGLSGNIAAISAKRKFCSSATMQAIPNSTATPQAPMAPIDGPIVAKMPTGITRAIAKPSRQVSCRLNSDLSVTGSVAIPLSSSLDSGMTPGDVKS